MERVAPAPANLPENARLVIDNDHTRSLTDEVVNIGRHYENTIILDDPQVSRFHVQLRLRFGTFMLFDVQSQSGTFVNGVRVEQHPLRTGDLIQLGQTRIMYLDDTPANTDAEQTKALPPVTP
jgi:pSer/pThr/pTyr-binding forkhead associated (FHA) protein